MSIMSLFMASSLACLLASTAMAAAKKPTFALSIFPLKALCDEILGDSARCVLILPPGLSPHTYEPKPSDFKKAQQAKRVFFVADQLDAWASRIPGVNATRLIDSLPRDMLLQGHDEADHDHSHTKKTAKPSKKGDVVFDPHVWLDPSLASLLADAMAKEMIALSPDDKVSIDGRLADFKKTLAAKDKEWDKLLEPVRHQAFVIYHPFLDYFVRHYRLAQVGKLEPFPGKEPSPRYLKDMIATTRTTGAKAIFVSPQIPTRAAEAFAKATGVKIGVLDDIGGGNGRRSFFALMQYNVDTLRQVLP